MPNKRLTANKSATVSSSSVDPHPRHIGILWNGDSVSIDERGFTDMLARKRGDKVLGANDARREILTSSVKKHAMKDELSDVIAAMISEHAVKRYGTLTADKLRDEDIHRLSEHAVDYIRHILNFVEFTAASGEYNLSVRIYKSVTYSGKFRLSDKLMYLPIWERDTELPAGMNAVHLLADVVKGYLSDELGFFIQEYDESSNRMDDRISSRDQDAWRVSWYKPDVAGARNSFEYMVQVESWEKGVPISDILA